MNRSYRMLYLALLVALPLSGLNGGVKGREVKNVKSGCQVLSMAISPDGASLLAGCSFGTLLLYDVSTGKEVRVYKKAAGGAINPVFFSKDGKIIYESNRGLLKWSIDGMRLVKSRPPVSGRGAAFHPDGTVIAELTGGNSMENFYRNIRLIDTDDLTEKKVIDEKVTGPLQFSPDGKLLGAAFYEKIKILKAKNGRVINVLKGHSGPVGDIDFSPDSKTLASSGYDYAIIIWDLKTGRKIKKISTVEYRHWYGIGYRRICYSRDGKYIGYADNKQIFLFDAGSGKLVKRYRGHKGEIRDFCFTRDGRLIISAADDGTIRFWAMPK